SADGSTLYFTSDRSGGVGSYDIWQVSISTVIDLNGDGIINAADMCIMVDHWGEDYSLCDIAPPPFGDGIVDVQDLILLSEHLFEEIFPVELIGYWKLDEEEGDIAYNSIGDNHGILSGNPTWQPDSGQVAGTLEFDGTNDYVETGFVLNPTDGAFSVFAWIKGGAPGQVIISQADGIGTGETWLGMDALGGNLMTGLMPYQVGRTVIFPLESQSLITDGQWHHIGFVWDGSYRSLYVDGTEVAKDTNPITLSPLIFADGGLYFGTSKILDAGTFFSGLIDDVHIYDKTLTTEQIAALAQ
ncbi:LamG-like jellyroll fold domain-containing protein, partial [Planctomycetota bacterium]